MSVTFVKDSGTAPCGACGPAAYLRGGAVCRHRTRPAGILVPPLTGSGQALIRYRDGRREAAWVDPLDLFPLPEGTAP